MGHLLLYLFHRFRYSWGNETTLRVCLVPPVPDYSRHRLRSFASWLRNRISIRGYSWSCQCRSWSPALVGSAPCNVIELDFCTHTYITLVYLHQLHIQELTSSCSPSPTPLSRPGSRRSRNRSQHSRDDPRWCYANPRSCQFLASLLMNGGDDGALVCDDDDPSCPSPKS